MSGPKIESVNHQDTGCPDGLIPSCLNCHLPRCRFEDGEAERRAAAEMRERVMDVRELRAQGVRAETIAERLGISKRTVARWANG